MVLVEQIPAETYLKGRHVHFEVAPHRGVYTARSEARALGIPADYVLKVVMLRIDDRSAMAVLPASRRIDMPLVKSLLSDSHVRLATESEIAEAYPSFELGALPPLPGLLGVRALIDPLVFEHEEVGFADGRQTESLIASPRELFWGEEAFVASISRAVDVWGPWGIEADAMRFG